MTREEALAKRQELVEAAQSAIDLAQKLTEEHGLHSFDLTIKARSYGTQYTGHIEVSEGNVDAWVSSTYIEDDWESSEC